MKKSLFLAATLLFTFTCMAEVVTPSQALQIAEEFLGEDLAPQRVRGMRGVAPAAEQENAPLYVISRGDDRGFVLVSGDDSQPSIIGYTDHGNFDENDLPPALQDLMDRVSEAVRAAQLRHAPARPAAATREGWHTIDPLITTHWNQGWPWNSLCPYCTDNGAQAVAGCVAIAAAQIIYYFRKDLPHELQNTTPTYPSPYSSNGCDVTISYSKGTPLPYELMFDGYSGSEPEDIANAVGLLCFTVGACSNMNYWHSSATGISSAGSAMTNYFGLSGTYMYREESFPADQWLSIAYSSLSEGSPLLYSGYRRRDNSAHAYIYDGYDANTGLWHINFGWGGNYDGYYTIDYETAGDGFGEQQQLIHHIRPHHLNLAGEIVEADTLYTQIDNTVTIKVTNNGTVPMTDYRAYLQASDEAPTAESTPMATNEQTYVAPDETASVMFDMRPTELGDYYLYVTDRNGDVLDHQKITVAESAPQLAFQGLTANLGIETVETAQGTFQKYNNDEITLYAEVSNAAAATPGMPGLTFTLTQWDAEQGVQVPLQSTMVNDVVVLPGESKTIECTFTNLSVDALLTATVTAADCEMASADTTLCFVVGGKTLTLSEPVDGAVTVTGGWDSSLFAQLACDPFVTAYDLTDVTGLQAPLTAANPNALFYVNTSIAASNIIVDGECADLVLTSGYDFRPVAPFHAAKAAFAPAFTPGIIYTLILPFQATAPLEYLCRYHSNIGKTYFGDGVNVETLEAGMPYLITNSAAHPAPFTGEDVNVMVRPDTAVTKPYVGTFVARCLFDERLAPTNNILTLDVNPTTTGQYFELQDSTYVASPFTAVISHDSKKVRATVDDTLEKAYKKLATALADAQSLYDALNANMTDSANYAMQALLDEGRGLWHPMQEQAAPINKYVQRLEEFCSTYPRMVAVITEPLDYTDYIKNPSFETGNKNGWKTDSHATVRSIKDMQMFLLYNEGQYYLQSNYANKSTEISQTVKDLPAGYYRLSVMVCGEAGATINVFAGDSVYAAPASPLGRRYLTEAVVDSVYVRDGELPIGIKGSDTWYRCDDFKLYFLGGTAPDDPDTKVDAAIMPQPVAKQGLYDLQGRKLQSIDEMQPGVIYLYNGRKTIRMKNEE